MKAEAYLCGCDSKACWLCCCLPLCCAKRCCYCSCSAAEESKPKKKCCTCKKSKKPVKKEKVDDEISRNWRRHSIESIRRRTDWRRWRRNLRQREKSAQYLLK
ncbi:uncharacterized protein LOC116121617 isoform X1 [Pistacia vera]|uniref:uncharacterized protein LOC116121617 isoform X1 n=1 Tax=Pistacia vera TaxID=55513 RepID=UPI0012635B90|nr:uncharacterized protein LOC116121617 isoform X1 [Pistacia vera]